MIDRGAAVHEKGDIDAFQSFKYLPPPSLHGSYDGLSYGHDLSQGHVVLLGNSWGSTWPRPRSQNPPYFRSKAFFHSQKINGRYEEGFALQALKYSERLLSEIDTARNHINRVYRVQIIPDALE